ncbi:MAG: carbohydrate kinase family protein [Actinobacteria bacterium]|nr:carbohydrate kinase family protein [Actinomycetota bacterium]
MSPPDLICVGDVMVDVGVEAPALVRGGDVHGRVRIRPAGSATNAAVWAAWSGAQVRLHGRIGTDLIGRLVAESLAERGVLAELALDPEAPTGSMLVVSEAGDRSMVADRGANGNLSPGDLPSRLEAGAVLVSGYLIFHPGSEEAARAALERASAPFVAVDVSSWPLVEAYGPDRFLEACGPASVLLANEREAEALVGSTGVEAAKRLAERFPLACVKLGARGALVAVEGDVLEVPPVPAEPVDPTGAGDAFDGVFLASLSLAAPVEDAAAAAVRAGALATASPDPWPARRSP